MAAGFIKLTDKPGIRTAGGKKVKQHAAVPPNTARVQNLCSRSGKRNRLVETLAATETFQPVGRQGFSRSYKMIHRVHHIDIQRSEIQHFHSSSSPSFQPNSRLAAHLLEHLAGFQRQLRPTGQFLTRFFPAKNRPCKICGFPTHKLFFGHIFQKPFLRDSPKSVIHNPDSGQFGNRFQHDGALVSQNLGTQPALPVLE